MSDEHNTPPPPLGEIPAATILERFGGIRPMAAKMDVPVTTVQGWKKRGTIPGNRRADIQAAARRNGIDLGDLVEGPTVKSETAAFAETLAAAQQNKTGTSPFLTQDSLTYQLKQMEIRTIRKAVLATMALLVVFAVAVGLLAAVGNEELRHDNARLAALESGAPANPGFLSQLSVELRARMDRLESAITKIKTNAPSNLQSEPKGEIENFDSLTRRLGTVEEKLQTLTDLNPALSGVVAKLEEPGQLQDALNGLRTVVAGLQGRMDTVEGALAKEQKTSSALSQTLQDVSPRDLKAAAMLIGLTQFRQALDRGAPFADSLSLLQSLTDGADPALGAAMQKISPYAAGGVPSSAELSVQLAGLAGNIAAAALSGQDISIKDQAMARLQNVISIRKDGQPVGGTATQTIVAQARQFLAQGRVDAAVRILQTLQGPALLAAQPVISQGQTVLAARNIQTLIGKKIAAQAKALLRPAPLTTQGAGVMGPFLKPGPATGVR